MNTNKEENTSLFSLSNKWQHVSVKKEKELAKKDNNNLAYHHEILIEGKILFGVSLPLTTNYVVPPRTCTRSSPYSTA